MRWLLLALPLAACVADPVPDPEPINGDLGPSADAVDVGGDDRAALPDFGPRDVGFDAGADIDVWMIEEDPAPDRPDVQSVDARDALTVSDAADCATDVVSCRCPDGTESSHDVCLTEWCNCFGHEGGPDAGADAAMDASGADAGDVNVPADRPDVVAVDVPRDAGPVDAGPVVYDLEAARAETSYRVTYRRISKGSGSTTDCDAPPTATSCSITSGTLRFSLHTCSTDFTGTLPLSTTTGRVVSIFAGGGGSSATVVQLTSGRRVVGSPARQSFHVQIAAPVQNNEPGVTGIPGRTVDPALADLWLLGCPSD